MIHTVPSIFRALLSISNQVRSSPNTKFKFGPGLFAKADQLKFSASSPLSTEAKCRWGFIDSFISPDFPVVFPRRQRRLKYK